LAHNHPEWAFFTTTYSKNIMTWQNLQLSIPLGHRPRLSIITIDTRQFRTEGSYMEHFQIKGLWCLHAFRDTGELIFNDIQIPIRPGHVNIIPPDAHQSYHWHHKVRHVYAHFQLNADASGDTSSEVSLPVMYNMGKEFEPFIQSFEQITNHFAPNRLRAEIQLWELLWRFSDAATPHTLNTKTEHQCVTHARRLIEAHLGEPIYITQLAYEVGMSHNQLTRLFRSTTGLTVAAYIRQRRMQHAQHLLQHSTVPIKTIASQVGIPDLHTFNRVVREHLGTSPRQVRAASTQND
jgi:AraC-like DNA-binding protein